jgi:hypothetical protein
MSLSVPVPPRRESLPAPPSSVLLPVLPVITLFRELPVPFKFPVPVKVKFSKLFARV